MKVPNKYSFTLLETLVLGTFASFYVVSSEMVANQPLSPRLIWHLASTMPKHPPEGDYQVFFTHYMGFTEHEISEIGKML